jgi:hypothetical protein
MAREWPTDPDDPVDPALAPLIEAGEGEAEGFELAEADLIEHARHDDQRGTEQITRDAAGFDDPESDEPDDTDLYGEPDTEEVEDA